MLTLGKAVLRQFTVPMLALALAALQTAPLFAQTGNRVVQDFDRAETQTLPFHHPSWANAANDLGLVPSQQILNNMVLVLKRSPQQEAALKSLLANQQNPSSSAYHQWLTPTQMGERFGLSRQDVASVSDWLRSQGLQVKWVGTGRTSIGFAGSAAAVGRCFQTEMHYYRVNGQQRMSVSVPPRIPSAVAGVVMAVRGLFTVEEHPLHSSTPASAVNPAFTSITGSHFLAPADFATIYDLPSGLTGVGATIGIVGRSRTDYADFANFRDKTGAAFSDPVEVVPTALGGVDPGPAFTSPPLSGISTDDQSEATLDVLRAGSVAPDAQLLLVVATDASGGIGVDAQYLVETDPLPAQVMNISFGNCELAAGPSVVAAWDALFEQAAAEGITVTVSAGDSGAAGCDDAFAPPPAITFANSPNFLCSSSYATCVGGTEFNDEAAPAQYWNSSNQDNLSSALSYIPEGAWNEPLNQAAQLQVASGGGGVSSIIPTPGWQAGAGVPVARVGRYTPDVSFSASTHDGYFGCFAAGSASCVTGANGRYSFAYYAGTSAAAPGLAGVAALLLQSLGHAPGALNPQLYQLATTNPSIFHDATVNSSGVTDCTIQSASMCNNSIAAPTALTGGQPGYALTTGYDEATGLGSLDVAMLVRDFAEPVPVGLQFIPTVPCRVADTRNASGPFGGPELSAGSTREFDIPQSACNIPNDALAYSLNVTVVPDAVLGYLTMWPSGQTQPTVSTLNSDGRNKANAAITPAGINGGVSIYATDATHVILDIDGYFLPAGSASVLAFYPISPCRVADTRNAAGPLGGPSLAAGSTRNFPIQSGDCEIPSSAQAYTLNVTAVPEDTLAYLSLWPTGQTQPLVSTLNAPTGTIAANGAIVRSGTNGDISVFVTDASDVVLDVNGYFAAPGDGGLSLYTVDPCRVVDTRTTSGAFNGTLQVAVGPSACAPPAAAQSYVLNATVVPSASLSFLTLWPAEEALPVVSTLNAFDGATTSNMALIETIDGNIDAYSSDETQLIVDLSGYFAP